jgi:hypothetical protein
MRIEITNLMPRELLVRAFVDRNGDVRLFLSRPDVYAPAGSTHIREFETEIMEAQAVQQPFGLLMTTSAGLKELFGGGANHD